MYKHSYDVLFIEKLQTKKTKPNFKNIYLSPKLNKVVKQRIYKLKKFQI